MTQLKTLKDLKNGSECPDCGSVHYSDLRVEAIKWIEETLPTDLEELFKGDFGDSAWFIKIQIDNWIKHFFNITDEELK